MPLFEELVAKLTLGVNKEDKTKQASASEVPVLATDASYIEKVASSLESLISELVDEPEEKPKEEAASAVTKIASRKEEFKQALLQKQASKEQKSPEYQQFINNIANQLWDVSENAVKGETVDPSKISLEAALPPGTNLSEILAAINTPAESAASVKTAAATCKCGKEGCKGECSTSGEAAKPTDKKALLISKFKERLNAKKSGGSC